jgi:hypothetical protein
MTEPGPISFSLLAAAITILGPVVGPYALVLFAACVGSALALSREPAGTRWEGVKFVVMGALVALLITGSIVWGVQKYLDVPGNIALVPVAFALGAARGQLLTLITKALDGVAAVTGVILEAAANRRGGGQ